MKIYFKKYLSTIYPIGTNEIKVITLLIKWNFKTINAYYLIINLDLSLNL